MIASRLCCSKSLMNKAYHNDAWSKKVIYRHFSMTSTSLFCKYRNFHKFGSLASRIIYIPHICGQLIQAPLLKKMTSLIIRDHEIVCAMLYCRRNITFIGLGQAIGGIFKEDHLIGLRVRSKICTRKDSWPMDPEPSYHG